jgi:hypothetical protein
MSCPNCSCARCQSSGHCQCCTQWRELANKYSGEFQQRNLDEAKALSAVWHQNLTADYWLLYYVLMDIAPDLPEKTVREAYRRMVAEKGHVRANEIRPINTRFFADTEFNPGPSVKP